MRSNHIRITKKALTSFCKCFFVVTNSSKIRKLRFVITIVSILVSSICAWSQIMYDQYVSSDYAKIKSVTLRPVVKTRLSSSSIHVGPEKGDSLATPVMPLIGENKGLMMDFDILEDEIRPLQWRIIHCDRNWRKSNLVESEYMTVVDCDFQIDRENFVDLSYNTTVPYVHYFFHFPFHGGSSTPEIRFLMSGNYVVQVYEQVYEGEDEYAYESDIVLIQKRFVVTEQLVEIQAEVNRPNLVQYMDDSQQISMKIVPHGFDLSTFDKDLYVVYRQNGRWDKTISGIQPNHVSGDGSLVFNDNRNALFKGGNEFRYFNFKNLRIATAPVDFIGKIDGKYTVLLHPDRDWHAAYTSTTDLNGKFLTSEDTHNNADYCADYADVKFTLPYHRNYYDTLDLYVFGGFNDWKMNDENKMTYNEERQQYEASILLKQGYYNYKYVKASPDFKTIDETDIDGSFYQTENEYEIFVYFYDYALGYDRCIGYKRINSVK